MHDDDEKGDDDDDDDADEWRVDEQSTWLV